MPRRAAVLDVNAILAGFLESNAPPEDEATEALLDATSALLASYGVRRWSMDDVAARAGLARATVYRRFEGRDELVHAALARDAHRFFAAIAQAVADSDSLEDKLVEGFIVGVRVVRSSLIPSLFESDAAAVMSLLTSGPVLALGRAALVERYEAITGARLKARERASVELVAEALVRLAVSFVLMPESIVDFGDERAARAALRRLVGPLLAPTR